MTQSELAEKAGTSTNTISDIECEKTWPTDETFEKIADVFSIKVCEILMEPKNLDRLLEQQNANAEENIQKYIDLLFEVHEAAKEIPTNVIQKLHYNISHLK